MLLTIRFSRLLANEASKLFIQQAKEEEEYLWACA
jgi:hypothetical protein